MTAIDLPARTAQEAAAAACHIATTAKFPVTFAVAVEWPPYVRHDGRSFRRTGKLGTNRATGLPAAEYAENGERVWLLSDGSVRPE